MLPYGMDVVVLAVAAVVVMAVGYCSLHPLPMFAPALTLATSVLMVYGGGWPEAQDASRLKLPTFSCCSLLVKYAIKHLLVPKNTKKGKNFTY